MGTETETKSSILTPLDPEAYERASVPTREQIRAAFESAESDLRTAAKQPRGKRIDPKLRFR